MRAQSRPMRAKQVTQLATPRRLPVSRSAGPGSVVRALPHPLTGFPPRLRKRLHMSTLRASSAALSVGKTCVSALWERIRKGCGWRDRRRVVPPHVERDGCSDIQRLKIPMCAALHGAYQDSAQRGESGEAEDMLLTLLIIPFLSLRLVFQATARLSADETIGLRVALAYLTGKVSRPSRVSKCAGGRDH